MIARLKSTSSCLSTLVRTAIPYGEFFSEIRGTATQWTESGFWTCDDEQWQTSFDPDHI